MINLFYSIVDEHDDNIDGGILNPDSMGFHRLCEYQSTDNSTSNIKNNKIHNFIVETWRPSVSFYFKDKRGGVNEVENKVVADTIAKRGLLTARKGNFIYLSFYLSLLFLCLLSFSLLLSIFVSFFLSFLSFFLSSLLHVIKQCI